jgi:hypothetical protein
MLNIKTSLHSFPNKAWQALMGITQLNSFENLTFYFDYYNSDCTDRVQPLQVLGISERIYL